MIEIHPGWLYAVPELIRLVTAHSIPRQEFHASFPTIYDVPSQPLIELACAAGWIQESPGSGLVVLTKGAKLQSIANPKTVLIAQLEDIICATRPAWAATLTQGRREFARTAPPDVVQCFRDAGLLEGYSPATVALIDSLQAAMRDLSRESGARTGRQGEYLTVVFEELRTGTKPDWVAIETNRAGYDVLSITGPGSSQRLPIEVKSTTAGLSDATLFFTRNECETARNSRDYLLHCWILQNPLRLLAVPRDSLLSHVPMDQASGEWQIVKIPFSTFASAEVPVPSDVTESISSRGKMPKEGTEKGNNRRETAS